MAEGRDGGRKRWRKEGMEGGRYGGKEGQKEREEEGCGISRQNLKFKQNSLIIHLRTHAFLLSNQIGCI